MANQNARAVALQAFARVIFLFFLPYPFFSVLRAVGTPARPDIPECTHVSRLALMVSEKKTETDGSN